MLDINVRLAALPLWGGPIEIEPLEGGLTNQHLLVRSAQGRFVARFGGDNAVHGLNRQQEHAAACAAADAAIGPPVIWIEPDLMILNYIEGATLDTSSLMHAPVLDRLVPLLRRIHYDLPQHYRGPQSDRRLPAIILHYMMMLRAGPDPWREAAANLQSSCQAVVEALASQPPSFVHNDVHAANLVDDGSRLWLLDWEYAGWGNALADCASLANNGCFPAEKAVELLERWCEKTPDNVTIREFLATRLGAALRDLLWGYAQAAFVIPAHAGLDDYIMVNRQRVDEAGKAFLTLAD